MAARFLEDVELGDLSVKESLAVHMAEEHLSVTKVCWVPIEATTTRLDLLMQFVGRSPADHMSRQNPFSSRSAVRAAFPLAFHIERRRQSTTKLSGGTTT